MRSPFEKTSRKEVAWITRFLTYAVSAVGKKRKKVWPVSCRLKGGKIIEAKEERAVPSIRA